MICYLCGRICDTNVYGLCVDCIALIRRNNERVEMLSLLNEAQEFCPLPLRERIEKILERIKPPFK